MVSGPPSFRASLMRRCSTKLSREISTPTAVARDRLGILRPGVPAHRDRVQTLYLPIFLESGASPVPEDGYALVDFALVQHGPQREIPPVRLQQRVVLDYEQPRRLVRVEVQVELVKLPVTGVLVSHALPPPSSMDRAPEYTNGCPASTALDQFRLIQACLRVWRRPRLRFERLR